MAKAPPLPLKSTTDTTKVDPDAPPSYGEASSHATTSVRTAASASLAEPKQLVGKRACIMLARIDQLQVVNFPSEITQLLDTLIRGVWKKGVQQFKFEDGLWQWKLKGRPWLAQLEENLASRQLLLAIISALSSAGWQLETAMGFSIWHVDKDSLFFKQVANPPLNRTFFAVTFQENDKVRLMESPNERVLEAMSLALNSWPKGLQQDKDTELGIRQYKLKGTPWLQIQGEQMVHARQLMCTILERMDEVGYELVAGVNMSIGNDGRDIDTWFFGSKSA